MNTNQWIILALFAILTWAGSAGIALATVELSGGGEQGPPGSQGDQGPSGERGARGPAGESAAVDASFSLVALGQRVTEVESFNQYQVCFLEADREDRDAYHQYLAGGRTFEAYQATHEAVLLDEQQCLDLHYPY